MMVSRVLCAAVLLAVGLGVVPRTPLASELDIEEFHAYLLPELSYANPGDFFQITFEVDSTAKRFNGYEITIEWEQDVVSFVSVDEGSLMENACPERWFEWDDTDSTVTCAHVLLCGGVNLDGPGVLSTYEFYAREEGGTPLAITTDPNRAFFDQGLYIWPGHPAYPRLVVLHDAGVYIGSIP